MVWAPPSRCSRHTSRYALPSWRGREQRQPWSSSVPARVARRARCGCEKSPGGGRSRPYTLSY
eukprot:5272509-Prymnesium_polylepis.1